MRKKIITTTTLLFSILLFTISASCSQRSDKKKENNSDSNAEAINELQTFTGQEWLKSIFLCNNDCGFCFPDEEKVTTERYYEFFIETIGIYEYPMFETEDERIAAEKVYKNKWREIYPLDGDVSYPFGRGNGTGYGDPLKDVNISPQSDTEFTLLIDYGGEIKALTELRLIPKGDSYLIDYMKSVYIE